MHTRLKHKPTARRATDSFSLWPTLLFFVLVTIGILLFSVFYRYAQKIHGVGLLLLKGDLKQVASPVSGTVEAWRLEEGDPVKIGDNLATLREGNLDSATIPVVSKVAGVLGEIIAYPDTPIKAGQAIAIITNHGDPRKDLELIGFVSSLQGKKIEPGMRALVDPSVTDPFTEGHLLATVKKVGKLPMTKEAVQSVIKIPEIAKYIRKQIEAEPFVVALNLIPDKKSKTGYRWSGPGPNFLLDTGIIAEISIIYDERPLIELLWPAVFHLVPGKK